MVNEPGLLIHVAALKISPIERLSELAVSLYSLLEPHIDALEKPVISVNTNCTSSNEVDEQESDTTIETTFTTTTTTTTTKEVKIKTGKPCAGSPLAAITADLSQNAQLYVSTTIT
jgi:hypothetical protein